MQTVLEQKGEDCLLLHKHSSETDEVVRNIPAPQGCQASPAKSGGLIMKSYTCCFLAIVVLRKQYGCMIQPYTLHGISENLWRVAK